MRPIAFCLLVAGVVLAAIGLWLATIFPVRSHVTTVSGGSWQATDTFHLNLWGTPLQKTSNIRTYDEGRLLEFIEHGPVNGSQRHGHWTKRMRENGGAWMLINSWNRNNLAITQEEWEGW